MSCRIRLTAADTMCLPLHREQVWTVRAEVWSVKRLFEKEKIKKIHTEDRHV